MADEGDRHRNLPPHLKMIRYGFVGFVTWSEMGPKKETKSAAGMVETRLLYIFTLKSSLVGMMPSCDNWDIFLFVTCFVSLFVGFHFLSVQLRMLLLIASIQSIDLE